VWLTADVHYAAAHYYNPDRAQFQDYESVKGPFEEVLRGVYPAEADRSG
jgi:alkaline phosphatase D